MSDIQYICLSDLHFGAYNSLFTYVTRDGIVKPERTTETLIRFLNILEHIINLTNKKKKVTLEDLQEISSFDRFEK